MDAGGLIKGDRCGLRLRPDLWLIARWAANGKGRHVYQFRLRPEASGAAPLVDETGLTGDSISISDLPPGTYRWSVGVQHFEGGESATTWLPEQSLTVAGEEGSPRARVR